MLFYPTEALRPGWLTLRRAVLQLLPVVVLVGLDYLLPFSLAPIIAFYPAVLAVLLASHIRAYRIWCEENYSSMDYIDVQWIVRYMMMLLIIGGSFLYMCFTHNPVRAFTQQWLLLFLFVYGTEQILFRRSPWPEEGNAEKTGLQPSPEPVAADEPDTDVPTSADAQALTQWMESEKPYLNPEFKLMDLREVLPMNRSYLSQFINDTYGCTFYQLVNRYRIDEAKRLMRECPGMRIEEIAARSGFASRSSFTQTFTRETGFSPREWSKKCYNS
jgi:AraC-like DNA-binding protein